MPNPNGKIIGAEGVRTFIGYSGWPITLQLSLETLASLCKLIDGWPSGPVVVCASFTCEFFMSQAIDEMDTTALAGLLYDYQKRKSMRLRVVGLSMLSLFFTLESIR